MKRMEFINLDQLPTYMEMNDKRYLLAYQVRIKDLPDGFAATYLHKEGVADDCNSDLDMMQDGVLVDENESSLIIAAIKVSDEDFKACIQLR